MCAPVPLQPTALSKLTATHVTRERSLTGVCSHMKLQIAMHSELLAANVTIVRSLVGMHSHVLRQVRHLFIAHLAGVRFDTCVDSHVSFKLARLSELPLTYIT